MARLKILFTDTVGSRGGAERSMFELASALAEMSVEVAAVLPEGEAAEWFRNAGIKIYPCPFVRLHKPSVFHPFRKTGLFSLHSVRGAIQSAAKDFFKSAGRQYLVANNFAALLALDKFRVQGSEFKNTPSAAEMEHVDNCTLLNVHCSLKTVWHVRDFPPKWQIFVGIRKADLVFAISKPVYRKLRDAVPKIYRHKIHLVENGIDLSRFTKADTVGNFKSANSISNKTKIVTMAANLVPWKRHDLFIEIAGILADRYVDVKFVIAGSDLFGEHEDYVAKLKKLADRKKLSGKMLFLENTADIGDLLRDSAVLVHPTPVEPFGRVICEAMACGVPVVASAGGGPASVIENGETGILVAGDNPLDWAGKISYILDDDATATAIASAASTRIPDIRVTSATFLDTLNSTSLS